MAFLYALRVAPGMSGLTVATFRVPMQLLTPEGAVADNAVPQLLEICDGRYLYRLTQPLGRIPTISPGDMGFWIPRTDSRLRTVDYVSRVGWPLTSRSREVFLSGEYVSLHCLVLLRNPLQADSDYLVALLNEQDRQLRRAAYLSSERGMFFGDREPV